MATVADTFNRANTAQGTLGSTDTGNLPWQNPTYWEINSNAAKNTQSDGVAWVEIPNPDATIGIVTGAGGTHGNGVGAAFWVEDASNYWIAYVHSERYVFSQTCNNECVGGYYTCQSCEACGGGNTNPITYVASDTNSYVSTVGCGCTDTVYGTCSCDGATPSRSTGNVNMTVDVCGDANCSQLSGNVADVCTIQYDFNPTFFNPVVPGNLNESGGNLKGGNLKETAGTIKGGNLNPGNLKGGNVSGGGNYKSGGNQFGGLPRTYNKLYREPATYNPIGYNAITYNAITYNAYSYNAPTYNAYSYNAPTYSYNAYSYNAITYSYNAPTGGNEGGGNQFSFYVCVDGGTHTGPCTTSCTPVQNATDPCSGANCPGDDQTCVSCGTTGKQYTRQCICSETGGNVNPCNTCGNCYDPCLTTQQVCTDNYKYRYKLKVDRISAGTRTNHYTSAALYDDTSPTQSWQAIDVETTDADYVAQVYSDTSWTTSVLSSGTQASGQSDYLDSVGHGIGVAPLGTANPAETDSIDTFNVEYVPLGGDSVGIMIG
jgi:hypothetical protein